MKLHHLIEAQKGVITVQPTDLLVFDTWNENSIPMYQGQPLPNSQGQQVLGSPLFHGTSSSFGQFKGSNIYLTSEIEGAIGFASLGEWFNGCHTPEGGLRVLGCTLLTSKVYTPKTNDKLLGVTRGSADQQCQRFLKDHPEYEVIHFTTTHLPEFDDAGTTDVWFTSHRHMVHISNVHRVFLFDHEYPGTWPTQVRKDPKSRLSKFEVV